MNALSVRKLYSIDSVNLCWTIFGFLRYFLTSLCGSLSGLYTLYCLCFQIRLLWRMKRETAFIVVTWPSLIWWCGYLLLLPHNFDLSYIGDWVVIFTIIGLDNKSWNSWFRILFKRTDLPSFRWLQVRFPWNFYSH